MRLEPDEARTRFEAARVLHLATSGSTAAIEHDGTEHDAHWRLLHTKYPQYDGQTLTSPIIAITAHRWSGWAYSPQNQHGSGLPACEEDR
jgi:hypothetical protein